MVRYMMAAAALKLFSINPYMKELYRFLGNTLGAKKRIKGGLPSSYLERAKLLLELVRKYEVINDGDKLLEIGTGWVHWESTFIRLFYDVHITLFDVWDNRQLKPFKRYLSEFAERFDQEIDIPPVQREQVKNLLGSISSVDSFDEVYHLLGFEYIIEPKQMLYRFHPETFNVIFSCSVLEHIKKDILSSYVQNLFRVLMHGGWSIHTICVGDHIAYYDPNVSEKNYLRYSPKVWKKYFENEVQYFNRVQCSEWLDIFRKVGFELLEKELIPCNIDSIKICKEYENLTRQDLECETLRIVHRKPK